MEELEKLAGTDGPEIERFFTQIEHFITDLGKRK